MVPKFVGQFAAAAMLTLIGCTGLSAQAQAPDAPAITLTVTDGMTIHQSDGVVVVGMTASDAAGLHSAFVSGGYSSVTTQYTAGIKSATVRLYFYASYYPVGDYTIRCGAVNSKGVRCDRALKLHLVK